MADQLGTTDLPQAAKCPSGRYSVKIGYDSRDDGPEACQACPKGRWSQTSGIDELAKCFLCGTGRYNIFSGSNNETDCIPCPRGNFMVVWAAKYSQIVNLVLRANRKT